MKLFLRVRWISLPLALLLAGCTASFEPRMATDDLMNSRLSTAAETRAGLKVSVEEFFSPDKSRRAFDAELGPHGVLPLLVRVENGSADSYRLERGKIEAFLEEERLSPLYGYQAAEQGAKRDFVWNALVNTMAMGPLAIYFGVLGVAASASQAQEINRKVEHHFERLELADAQLKPTETVAGFVFYKLPDGVERLEGLTLIVTVEADGAEERAKPLTYRLPLPTLQLPNSYPGPSADSR